VQALRDTAAPRSGALQAVDRALFVTPISPRGPCAVRVPARGGVGTPRSTSSGTPADLVMQLNGGNQTVPTVVFPDGTVLTDPGIAEVTSRLASS
jgi:hypothetical protein